MNTFTVISTVFGLVMTAFVTWLTIRANHNAKSAPFDERQAALRMELRARLNSQFRLVRAVDNVDRGLLPGSPVEADLDELRTYLNAKKHRFMVPTPEQIEVVIKSIDSALAALAVITNLAATPAAPLRRPRAHGSVDADRSSRCAGCAPPASCIPGTREWPCARV